MSDSDVLASQSVMRCTLMDVTTEDEARCAGRSLEIAKRRGAAGPKYVKCDPMSMRKLELVCRADGHEIKSTEQLQQHLSWGHGKMFLMREETELD
ncbi:hypothetical protein RvY_00538 [Ramazzottius varieornatus]|uniref:Uncharacterized protein n=1 Tax=Ramazzottius varieornatus TaxID=947166 RepID=A0A1D1UJE5_RAMVA|nr:hypothetical protein RvY_00538 [Ramazzottius varieornatus]